VAHDEPGKPALGLDGSEPTMKQHFFERIRPIVEASLLANRREDWPIITLNLDLKTEEPEHLAAIWAQLQEYRAWLTTAPRATRIDDVQPLTLGPILVLTGESEAQRRAFHDAVPVGQPLLVFGAARPVVRQTGTPSEARVRAGQELADTTPGRRTNYHRWWNNPWSAVELGGQTKADAWTQDDEQRLRHLVDASHRAGLWIRFYTLNGHAPKDESGGWSAGYNFGALEAARVRWQAAIRAGVDFVATDQYELFSATLREERRSSIVLEGTLTDRDYERLLERPFTVPPGTRHIEVALAYTGTDEKTVVDLGLRGPAGLRGWSGGGPQTIQVSALRASYGYLPGPIEPGEWAVVLGVPNIRQGRRDSYTLRVTLSASDVDAGAASRRSAGWFVGDLHTHSGHSDGRVLRDGGRVPAPPGRVFDAAAAASLDFVALTDHNTASHWLEVDRLQPAYAPLLLLHGREITTYRGHANAIGERRFHDFRLGPATVADVLGGPRADGAFVSINHPTRPDDERCMGCGWNDLDEDTLRAVDGIEVVNGDGGDLDGWRFWADLLNRGFRLTAVGGSDDHTPEESVDKAIGRPATVVFASELSEAAIVAGLKAGRAYIRTAGPTGPTVSFTGESRSQQIEMGATAMPGRLTLRAKLTRAEGTVVAWMRNGNELSTSVVGPEQTVSLDVDAVAGDWFSVIVHDRERPAVISNAIYVARQH
jgi:predicted metal-dependent phosphoesterase TrpH